MGQRASVLILACGALAHEITTLIRVNGWDAFSVKCLPADLHNTPERIPGAVREQIARARGRFDRIFVAYADCGTGGLLDAVLEQEGVERIPGPHCYQFFAGAARFEALHEAEPGTFYLTDFLVEHFERIMIRGLGLDRHPELLAAYFGNYRRLVYLAQRRDPALVDTAKAAARRLGLEFEHRDTGYGELETELGRVYQEAAPWQS
jgi:hypothetical protein